MLALASARITRRLLVPLLSLWIAGAGCLFGCEIDIMAAPTGQAAEQKLSEIVSGEACASEKSHDCCQTRRNSSKATETQKSVEENAHHMPAVLPQGSSHSMGVCPLAVGRNLMSAKARDNDTSNAALQVYATPVPNATADTHASVSTHTYYPNRGHTYLNCCVFLI